MVSDKIIRAAKQDISYDRHVVLVGKEQADSVLWFWLQGYEYWVKKEVFAALDIATKENGYELNESDYQQAIELGTYSPILEGREPEELMPFVEQYRKSNIKVENL